MKKSLCAGSALLAIAIGSTPAFARAAGGAGQTDVKAAAAEPQAATSASPQVNQPEVGDIIVTAQKRSESINKVGLSITAVTGEALERQGIASTADLVKIVPGFNFTPSAYGTPVLTLRGIGFYDTALGASPTVSAYVDEAPLPLSAMAQGVSLDLDRVEVLKGPQGTLFGQNATGGAINYIAAKPTDTFRAGADLTYGRFNRVEAKGFLSGPLSDTLEARIAVRYDRSDDWQRSYTRNETSGKGDFLTGRILLDWRPSDRLKVSFNANGWRDKSDNQAAQLVAIVTTKFPSLTTYPLPPRNNRAADWDPGLELSRDSNFWQTSLRIDYQLSDYAKITSISAYEQLRRRSIVDADGTAIANYSLFTPGHSRDFSQELRLAGDVGSVKYVVGGNYAFDKIHDEADPNALISRCPFVGVAKAVSDQTVRSYAVFGNLDFKIADTVTLQGGVRYTDQHRQYAGCTYDGGTGGPRSFAAVLSAVATARSGQPVTIPSEGCGTLGPSFLPGVVHSELNEDNV
ncbi:MAG: TonB-dependent receptor [Proteobacteria bacterium]|nr:TonB-dependent receptor [Pseudomonadota bacterium]